ncbi:MAG: hypothetical protein L3J69_19115 [Desulfobacula sp.]|nr:hypothetical protein [Desulfobacula sp.]
MTDQFVFFPFTHITQRQLETLLTFVEPFHFLSTDADKVIDPFLKPVVGAKKGIAHGVPDNLAIRVTQLQAQYLDWVKIHQGNEHNLKSLIKDHPYFKDATQVASIKSQLRDATRVASIKSQLKSGNKAEPKKDDGEKNLEQHLLFLKMAHLCDSQNDRIDIELSRLDENKDQLLSVLKGLEGSSGPGESNESAGENKNFGTGFKTGHGATDFGAVMTRERIESWAACMSGLSGYSANDPPVFVTTSQAVFDYLESICEDCLNALDINEIKVHHNDCENKKEWQRYFKENLKTAVQGGVSLEGGLPGSDDTCLLAGQVTASLFFGNEINKCFKLSDKQIVVCLIKLK